MAILSVSVTEDHKKLIKEHSISVTAVLRKALSEIEAYKNGELLESNASLQAKIARLSAEMTKLVNFIDNKGLFDEWRNVV